MPKNIPCPRCSWTGKPSCREQKLKDFKKAGIEYTIRQLDRLRMMGIEGLHIYAMNRWKDVDYLIREAGLRTVI